jgi:FAD/FMN-containing dehydrogenase
MTSMIEQLRTQLGSDFVLDSHEVRSRARNYWDSSPLLARALVRPRSTEEVSQVMRLCHAIGQSVVVHGGLTGVCDGDRSTSEDLVMSLERMTAIEEIDIVGRTVTAQAGCALQSLQTAVEREGLYFPLDLGARGSCTLGGNVSTNAGGINVIRYGMMRALVLGLEVVLPDGTVISSMNRMLKNNTGYDIKQLFIGSEGTLGVVTRMVLSLREQSVSVNTALVAVVRGNDIPELLKLMDKRLGGTLTSFEAMWGDYFRAVTAPGWHVSPMDRDHPFYVVIEAKGPHHEEDAGRFHVAIEQAFEAGLITDAVLPKTGAERQRVWAIRENFEAILQPKPVFLYDISLPLRHMIAYVDEVAAALRARWPRSLLYVLGHIGDGNLHFFIWPGDSADETKTLHAVSDEIVYRPLSQYQGAVSAEHGIGLEKKSWMPLSRSAAEIELMRALKRTIDPKGILNRGKVIDAYGTPE